MKWISVKDRLPPNFDFVLIGLLKESKDFIWHVGRWDNHNGVWLTWDLKPEGINSNNEPSIFPLDDETFIKVTHWMTLPEKPE